MNRINVISSNLKSVGYDPITKILEIEFKSNKVYSYINVPKSVYDGLINASSHGKYFSTFIRDVYSLR